MADHLLIPIEALPAYRHDDRIELEVAGQVLRDRVFPQPVRRRREGFGFGAVPRTQFGHIAVPGREVPFNCGIFGSGCRLYEYRTASNFVAGDYSVRLRGVDAAGNVGDFSDPNILAHRPTPPDPENLSVDAAGTLRWDWSDP